MLEFLNASIGYSGSHPLFPLSARYAPNSIHLILGKTGSGKTTLLKTLSGFIPLLAGHLHLQGTPLPQPSPCNLCFPEPEDLFFHETSGQEVIFALQNAPLTEDQKNTQGRDWLSQWGLPPETFWNRNPFTLSGGEKRRLALASCTISKVPIILLDEPLSGLDRLSRRQILAQFQFLAKNSMVFITTNEPELFFAFSPTITVLQPQRSVIFPHPGEFLQGALQDQGLYPLPIWYREALSSEFPFTRALPYPDPQEVASFLHSKHFRKAT